MFGSMGLGCSAKGGGEAWIEQVMRNDNAGALTLDASQDGAITFSGANNDHNVWFNGVVHVNRPYYVLGAVDIDIGDYAGAKLTFDAVVNSGTPIIKSIYPVNSHIIDYVIVTGVNEIIIPIESDLNARSIAMYLNSSPAFDMDISNVKIWIPE